MRADKGSRLEVEESLFCANTNVESVGRGGDGGRTNDFEL